MEETKFCGSCNETKQINEFSKNKCKKDGLQTKCKKCNRLYLQDHYEENKDYYAKKRQNVFKKYQNKVSKIKESTPCKDCGKYYPSYVMDFDHISLDKEFNISILINYGNWEKLQAEIDKCEVVCSNCHRIRTHMRRNAKRRLNAL